MEPSFYRLYRCSRYARVEEDILSLNGSCNRRELFTVASVAFTLKHDVKFRAHFLHQVCGVTQLGPKPAIEVQPFHHSDLAIKDDAASSLIVVEFKVGATLKPQQNPAETAFFRSNGYGKRILEETARLALNKKSYVVLDNERHFENRPRRGIDCRSATWADLVPEQNPDSLLWTDLIDSLADLNIAAFQFRKLKKMHNAQHTKTAVSMHQTLRAVASKAGFGSGGGEDTIKQEGDDTWYGRNVANTDLEHFTDLARCVQSKKDRMGWFGYQTGPGYCGRAVWFYCGSEEAAKQTLRFIKERLPNGSHGAPDRDGVSVYYESDVSASASQGDLEWFQMVFKALADGKPIR